MTLTSFQCTFPEQNEVRTSTFGIGPPKALDKPITAGEVRKSLDRLKNNRASGQDGISAELLKYGTKALDEQLAIIFNDTFEKHQDPNINIGELIAISKPSKPKGGKFLGRSITTLPNVLNKDLSRLPTSELRLKTNEDLDHLRSIAQDRQQWKGLTTKIREAAEESRRRILGYIIAAMLISIHLASNFGLVYEYDFDVIRNNAGFSGLLYLRPWSRVGPFVIGLLFGYILYRTKCKMHMNKLLVIIGWVLAIGSVLTVSFVTYDQNKNFLSDPQGWPSWGKAFYEMLCRPVWALVLGWIVVACATGHGGKYSPKIWYSLL
ncbi:nose resistant to fluoxetine protein 6-like [Elysia marginata]|uniref:Nose resistant to fluoxetine protein 6-like n=1 Tax=Elysia marginata TaxID=1093978 RepID=A0AAV4EHY7_9GAST|nr:nose resistant to fluoxetine protein 6-like [Elysia marginata]